MRASAQTLLELIADVLDLGKIESGMLQINAAENDFSKVLEDAVGPFRMQAQAKGVDLVLETPDSATWPNLMFDEIRVRQVRVVR